MQLKRSLWMPAVVGLIAVITGGWLLQQGQHGNVYVKSRLLQDVIRTVSDRYVEEVDPADLYDLATDGLIEQLGDPHTAILRPEDYADLRLSTTGNYGGLGIRIDEKDNWITVVQTLPSTPADRAGLRPGDRLIEADGESMAGWKADQAVRKLRGPKGAPVDLKISRLGVPEPIPVRIVRDEIHVQYVRGFLFEPGIGYIQHQQFSQKSAEDISRLVQELNAQGMKALVLDLRGNPGGLLEEGVAVSDLFLNSGSEVVETRSRIPEQNETYLSSRQPVDPDLPVIVLVDLYSASASEIVAGALQDHDRALVVGTQTFGKGSVQTLYPLPGGNYLKLTTAKWYTPSGRSIQSDRAEQHMLALRGGSAGPTTSTTGQSASAEIKLKVYYTDGGREVYGGGGINPDLVIEGEPLSEAELEFRTSLGEQVSAYSDAVFRFALAYSDANTGLRPNFEVTPKMLNALYAWLQDAGVSTDRKLFDGADRVIARDLGIQIATVAFDEEQSTRRRLVLDRQLETAIELLRKGRTQKELFALAAARQAEKVSVAREQGSQR